MDKLLAPGNLDQLSNIKVNLGNEGQQISAQQVIKKLQEALLIES